jgi:leucyl/phenylalanyl-tRNA--protein transferase
MKLTTDILEACYRAGAFPMADAYGRVEFYHSDPRSVLEFEDLHVPRSLVRLIR